MSRLPVLIVGMTVSLFSFPSYAQLYDFPFRAEHFDQGDLKIYWHRPKHSDGGVQEHGYDFGGFRYDNSAKIWTEKTVSESAYAKARANNKWILYGKNVYAMRDGKVIACWRNAPENPSGERHSKIDEGFIYGGGNGFWIEHSDGTRAEYAHFIPGSVPSNLCPHNATLMPAKIASPRVEDAWPHIRVEPSQQRTIKAGQLLGRVGNAGTSSNPHLHVHVEKGGRADTVKSGGEPVRINFRRGLAAPRDDGNPTPNWTSFAGKPAPSGPTIIWPPRSLVGEYARHGFPAERFQDLFDHLADSGYRPVWLDTYRVGSRSYINHVWRPAKGEWRAHILVSSDSHQSRTNDAIKAGFTPVFVDSSVAGSQARYTAIFIKGSASNIIMRHGLAAQQHDSELENARKRNLNPVNISVVSIGGQRSYTVLYRPETLGAWQVRSQIAENEYQSVYDANAKAGRRPVYLNAYMHGGKPFLSAVFASKPTSGRKDRHGMSAAQYQQEWQSAIKGGSFTHAVTSFDGAQSQHRFAASWWK